MSFEHLAAILNEAGVRYVVIGVAGANYWARSEHTVLTTKDFDDFLSAQAENAVNAWRAAEASGLDLFLWRRATRPSARPFPGRADREPDA